MGKDSNNSLRKGLGILENPQTRDLPTNLKVWLILERKHRLLVKNLVLKYLYFFDTCTLILFQVEASIWLSPLGRPGLTRDLVGLG